MKQYSTDLRERLCQARDAGLTRTEAVGLFGVSASSLSRWYRQHRRGAPVGPRPRPGRSPTIGPAARPALLAQVTAHPDATLTGHCARFAAEQGIRVSTATMSRHLAALGVSLKKRP